jgi:hypothetical protein
MFRDSHRLNASVKNVIYRQSVSGREKEDNLQDAPVLGM